MSEADERLYQAVKENDLRAATTALEHGASANYKHTESGASYDTSRAVLFVACQNKNKELVDLLLAGGADPNAGDSERSVAGNASTPCLVAAFPHIEIVRALLEKGADPNIPDMLEGNARSVLGMTRGNQGLIDLLKQYGAKLGSAESLG